ncbi:AMP-binding protein [Roseomonas sp. F4]
MFLLLDRKPPQDCAVKDDSGGSLTYGEIATFAQQLKAVVPNRSLAFCLCANDCGSLAGYLALYESRIVSLLLDASTDQQLLDNLIDAYAPGYMWCPEDHNDAPPLISFKGYKLVRMADDGPAMHDQLSFLLTTSGSTGSPKLVRHKYGNLEHNAKVVAEVFNWSRDERGLCQLPMHYTMGLNVVNSLLHAGSTVLLSKSSLMSREFWAFFKAHEPTSFTGVPYSYEIMLKMKLLRMDAPHLKVLSSGGGKLPEEIFIKLAEYAEATDRKFFSTFGTTETSARLSYLPPEIALRKIGSIGRAFPGGEMYLIDPDGARIEQPDMEGELVFRGDNVTMGYAQSQADLLLGDEFQGEYRTGDIARRDADGHFYIVGRMSRFLKLFGHRVSLDACEKLVSERFGTECVCTGTDKQMAIFVMNGEVLGDVPPFLAETTGLPRTAFKAYATSQIPRTNSGKVNYKELARDLL